MMKSGGACELCNGEVAAYCSADSAFLCWTCDAKVHQANFLVARHVRQVVCYNCKGFTGDRISGVGFQSAVAICPSCSQASASGDLDSLSSSSSSACVSSTQSSCSASHKKSCSRRSKRGRFDSSTPVNVFSGQVPWSAKSEAEGIFVNWCMRLGLGGDGANIVVRMACSALSVCLDRLTVLPFRVGLVASLWFGFRFCGVRSLSTWQALKKLEEISSVPAKLISAAESKLERLFKATRKQRRQHQLLQEGWAES